MGCFSASLWGLRSWSKHLIFVGKSFHVGVSENGYLTHLAIKNGEPYDETWLDLGSFSMVFQHVQTKPHPILLDISLYPHYIPNISYLNFIPKISPVYAHESQTSNAHWGSNDNRFLKTLPWGTLGKCDWRRDRFLVYNYITYFLGRKE